MKIKNIKTSYGKINYFDTKEASFNIETILPKKKTPTFYLKKSYGYLIIIKGELYTPKGKLKENEIIKIKPKQKFWMENKSNKKVKIMAIDIPPTKEKDIVWLQNGKYKIQQKTI